MSKNFGEPYQKTNKTKDTNKFSSIDLQNSRHPLQHTFETFVQLLKTISKGPLLNRSQNGCHTIFDGIHVRKTCTFDGRRLVPVFVILSRSFLGFCLLVADPNMAHLQWYPSLRESINTFTAHGFPTVHLQKNFTRLCSGLLLFVAKLLCMLLHCAVTLTSHTDYVQLAAVGLQCRSYAVHAVCRFPHVFKEPCACAHTCANFAVQM